MNNTNQTRCKHNMNPEECGFCNDELRKDLGTIVPISPGEDVFLAPEMNGWIILSTFGLSKGDEKMILSHLSESAVAVHVYGAVATWSVEAILNKAPNLKVLQVAPSIHDRLPRNGLVHGLCELRGVKLQAGYCFRPKTSS